MCIRPAKARLQCLNSNGNSWALPVSFAITVLLLTGLSVIVVKYYLGLRHQAKMAKQKSEEESFGFKSISNATAMGAQVNYPSLWY